MVDVRAFPYQNNDNGHRDVFFLVIGDVLSVTGSFKGEVTLNKRFNDLQG